MGLSMDFERTKRHSILLEEEEIVLKPSPELIPDEYPLTSSVHLQVHIFRSAANEHLVASADFLAAALQVTPNRIHALHTKRDLELGLEKIRQQCNNTKDPEGLLVFLLGSYRDQGDFLLDDQTNLDAKLVWNKFTTNQCPTLRDCPKLFVFYGVPTGSTPLQVDSSYHRHSGGTIPNDKVYEVPAEADILVVYKTEETDDFLVDFCAILQDNYQRRRYDFIELVMNSSGTSEPLMISTLTRRFYMTPAQERGSRLTVLEAHANLTRRLNALRTKVDAILNVTGAVRVTGETVPVVPLSLPPRGRTRTLPGNENLTLIYGKNDEDAIRPRALSLSDSDRRASVTKMQDRPRWRY